MKIIAKVCRVVKKVMEILSSIARIALEIRINTRVLIFISLIFNDLFNI